MVAVACATVALAGAASGAQAASSTHLTPSAWRVASASANATTAASCAALAKGATDEETRGVVGLCIDGADDSAWQNRLTGDCKSVPSASACLRDMNGEAADLKASGAWASWFTGQLGAGGCQTFFSIMQHYFSGVGTAIAAYTADLRARRPSKQLYADFSSYLSKFFALSSKAASSVVRSDLRGCNPAA